MGVFSQIGTLNLALNRGPNTWQSSTLSGAASGRAVDGDTNSNFGGGSCTLTQKAYGNFWAVDLGRSYDIGAVVIYNRQDCCANRLGGVQVAVSDEELSSDTDSRALRALPICNTDGDNCRTDYTLCASRNAMVTLNCAEGAAGRYVYVFITGYQHLTVCEVEVFEQVGGWGGATLDAGEYAPLGAVQTTETETAVVSNLASGASAWLSSTGFGAVSSRAIDGNNNGNWNGGSCACTNQQSFPWLAIDLGSQRTVNSVVIYNRQDCCADRLRGVQVLISNARLEVGQTMQLHSFPYDRCGTRTDEQGAVVTKTCGAGLSGRYVYVYLDQTQYLTVCEVEVMGY